MMLYIEIKLKIISIHPTTDLSYSGSDLKRKLLPHTQKSLLRLFQQLEEHFNVQKNKSPSFESIYFIVIFDLI